MAQGESPTTFHQMIPIFVQIEDSKGYCHLLSAYFDGLRLKIQFTQLLDFTAVAVVPPADKSYLEVIDLQSYYDTMDRLLKWAWEIVQGDTRVERLTNISQ
ncbi:hypothetical protein N7488_005155 [Penicillium malachiteum]|nr:hypothetical protein N7488_005155 [Penicillium malachiteum]